LQDDHIISISAKSGAPGAYREKLLTPQTKPRSPGLSNNRRRACWVRPISPDYHPMFPDYFGLGVGGGEECREASPAMDPGDAKHEHVPDRT